MNGKGNNAGNKVKGPASALLATLDRIGWTAISPTLLKDDEGDTYDLRLDPPIVVKQALDRSTRCWRIRRIGAHLPGLIPPNADDRAQSTRQQQGRTTIIDSASTYDSLRSNTAAAKK